MKHCRSCENCVTDPLSFYLKDIEFKRCVVDGHVIKNDFLERCEKYRRDFKKKDKTSSFLYQLVEMCKK